MQRIDHATAKATLDAPDAPGTAGYFTDGDPAELEAATILPAEFMNMMMLELMAIVLSAGIIPSKSIYDQVLSGLKSLAGAHAVISATTTAPPGGPSVGDAYLIPAGATGAWSAKVGQIATWRAGLGSSVAAAWAYATPRDAALAVAGDTGLTWRRASGTWAVAFATNSEHVAGTSVVKFANPAGVKAMLDAFVHGMTNKPTLIGTEELGGWDPVAGANRKFLLTDVAAFVFADAGADAFFYGMM